jgi:hypothetical protein
MAFCHLLDLERTMLRWMISLSVAIAVAGPAQAAGVVVKRSTFQAARQLPAGLPRAHYKYRTTIAPPAPYGRAVVGSDPDLQITPAYGPGGYTNLPGPPLFSTFPGCCGRAWDYGYQGGPSYDGAYVSYWDRLPYACDVYGHCY